MNNVDYESILQENASDISESNDEYDIKPEIHGNANIKIEMTDPTQYENSGHIVPEKKYGKEKQHICLICDTGYPTKISLLGHLAQGNLLTGIDNCSGYGNMGCRLFKRRVQNSLFENSTTH